MHAILTKKTVTRNEAVLDVAELREAIGLPADAEVELVPANDGKGFTVRARWTSTPSAPAAAPAPDPKPRGTGKGKGTPAATEQPKEPQPQTDPNATAKAAETKPAVAPVVVDSEDVP